MGTYLLTVEEVAARLSISLSLAYRMMRNGQIPSVRFRRPVRVRPEDLEEIKFQNLQGQATNLLPTSMASKVHRGLSGTSLSHPEVEVELKKFLKFKKDGEFEE